MILAALIFGTLFVRPAFFVLVLAAVLTAQLELSRAMRARGYRTSHTLGLIVGSLLLLAAYHRGVPALAFGLSLSIPAVLLWFLVDPERDGAIEGVAATLFTIAYVPFLGAHVVLLRGLPDGAALAVAYIGLTAFYDIGAYAFGSLFGKHALAPRISPKKTWEGAAGATAFILLLAMAVGPLIGPFTLGAALALAAVTAVLAPLGDLAESLVKRDLGIKDMGNVLPGHGGLMDRIDALLLVAPAAYWVARFTV